MPYLINLPLLLLLCLPVSTYAQRKECASLYKDYKDNRVTNPSLAYESAKEFLRRCPNTDPNLKKWTDAYEKAAYEPETPRTSPAESDPSPALTRTEPGKTPSPPVNIGMGRYYALVIGNDSYLYVPHLKTAVADARTIDSTLREQYGFATRLLINATRQEIFLALSHYRRNADQNDHTRLLCRAWLF